MIPTGAYAPSVGNISIKTEQKVLISMRILSGLFHSDKLTPRNEFNERPRVGLRRKRGVQAPEINSGDSPLGMRELA